MAVKCSVKEKRNLFPYDVWSLGDITPLPNLNRNGWATITYDKTSEYHTNGKYGLIATNTTNNKRPYVRYYFTEVSELIGEVISYSADVKTTKTLKLCIYQYDGSNYNGTDVVIPENSDGNYIVTTTISQDTLALWIGIEFQIAQQEGETFYTDNWELKIIPS